MADAGKVSLRPRGRFNINETYERLDFVKYNTGCYVALQTTTGNLPTDTTNFMNLIDFDIANMSQIGLVKPDGESTTIDADGTLHAHAVGSVTSFNGRTDEVLPQTGDYTAAQVAYDNTDSSLSANNVKSGLDELDAGKADNSVIAPVESGTTASQAYAVGAHFIRDGAFCTAKTAIAQGEAFRLNTNYTAGNIANSIKTEVSVRLINTALYYDATNQYFPIPAGTPKPNGGTDTFQLALAGRNNATGAFYIIWYDNSVSAFRIGAIISGNAPTEGQRIYVSYLG